MSDEPNLGLATTRQLLEELLARGEMSGGRDGELLAIGARYQLSILPTEMLDYRGGREAARAASGARCAVG